jgi:putative Holliday junction resolvase
VNGVADRRRVLGLDPGTKRIGVAIGVSGVAGPLTVIERSRSRDEDLRRIARLVDDEEAEVVVIGLPLGLDGREGAAARAARTLAAALARFTDVPIELHDERLTTVTADRVLLDAGMRAPERRQVVDKVAAAVMLQSWLDARVMGGEA